MSLTAYKRRAEAVHFEDQIFHKMDLRSMKAFGSTWKGCSFVECQIDLVDWRASKFDQCLFQDCSLKLANFSTSFFEDCLFKGCDLEQASFMGSQFRDGAFKDCRMAYGDLMFQDATAKGELVFEDCNLHGSNLDFREVEPKALTFTRTNLWGAKMSMGCAIWNGNFDKRLIQQFLALVARVSQDSDIARLAGDEYAVVMRAMGGEKVAVPSEIATVPE